MPRKAVTFQHQPLRDECIGGAPYLFPKVSKAALYARTRTSLIRIVASFFVLGTLCASAASHKAQKVSTEKTTESAVQRFSIHPNDITLAVSQTQKFGVIDADGKPVLVRWKISGVGCGTVACGTIDDNGAYQAPQSVSHPLVVMLEGIPVANTEYPAFARIQLAPGTAPAPISSPVNAQVVADTAQRSTNAQLLNGTSKAEGEPLASASVQEVRSVSSTVTAVDVSAPRGTVVTYQNGRLAIDANNVTLASVLRIVSQKTGAIIDVPPGTGLERIVEHAGPAPASDVLTQLLKGSHFNFVMIGSSQRPAELQQVLLTPRAEAETETTAAAMTPTPHTPPVPTPEPELEPDSIAPTVANGFGRPTPQDNGTGQPSGHMSRDELRELLKERAREVREGTQPGPPPPPQ